MKGWMLGLDNLLDQLVETLDDVTDAEENFGATTLLDNQVVHNLWL